MDLEKIVQELNARFAAPLPEFYKRRIIYWKDEDREFEDKLDEVVLTGATVLIMSGVNNFAVKKTLSIDDPNSNYLVYCPFSYDKDDDNWILDIELYSEEFRADLISIWMDEMGIQSTPALRKVVKGYSKFFNAKARMEKIKRLDQIPTSPRDLHYAVLGAIANTGDINPWNVIKNVLIAGLDCETNLIYQDIVTYGAEFAFWGMVRQGTGYASEEPKLAQLAAHIIMTALTRTLRLEYLAGLDGFISSPHQAFCFDFISEWLHADNNNDLKEIIGKVEDELGLPKRFMKLSVDDLAATELCPCVHEVILVKFMTEISENIIDVAAITNTVEKRRTCVWYDEVKDFYEGILQTANMQKFYKEHVTGFHSAQAAKVWKEYTTEYYKMDTYYRLFQKSYGDSLKSYNATLHDLFSYVLDKVQGLYENWFMGQLGANWSTVCAEELEKYGRIMEVPEQIKFYDNNIKNSGNRVFVVISDALRYEVAASLSDQLKREAKSKVDLKSMQGIFPTITKFGMAALLPHDHITAQKRGDILKVLADEQYTDSNYREKVLQKANPNSIVIRYTDLLSAQSTERSAMIKGKEVVYIYHDTIDEASHTADTMVFPACENAIAELRNLVRIIIGMNEYGGTRILITADHGFLYTYSPLREDDKVDKSGFIDRVVEYGRRYAIMAKGASPAELLPIRFLDGKTEYDAFAPRENVRIKMNGGGLNFVHGGISLQEMCVPLLEYRYISSKSKEYQNHKHKYDTKPVEISLLSATHKISNMIFSLNFYQKEAVGENREAATYQVYFTDNNGKQISDVQKIIADKTNENGQERTFRCSFNLKQLKYDNKEVYYLVIADSNGLIISRDEFEIDMPFAVDEFDFF